MSNLSINFTISSLNGNTNITIPSPADPPDLCKTIRGRFRGLYEDLDCGKIREFKEKLTELEPILLKVATFISDYNSEEVDSYDLAHAMTTEESRSHIISVIRDLRTSGRSEDLKGRTKLLERFWSIIEAYGYRYADAATAQTSTQAPTKIVRTVPPSLTTLSSRVGTLSTNNNSIICSVNWLTRYFDRRGSSPERNQSLLTALQNLNVSLSVVVVPASFTTAYNNFYNAVSDGRELSGNAKAKFSTELTSLQVSLGGTITTEILNQIIAVQNLLIGEKCRNPENHRGRRNSRNLLNLTNIENEEVTRSTSPSRSFYNFNITRWTRRNLIVTAPHTTMYTTIRKLNSELIPTPPTPTTVGNASTMTISTCCGCNGELSLEYSGYLNNLAVAGTIPLNTDQISFFATEGLNNAVIFNNTDLAIFTENIPATSCCDCNSTIWQTVLIRIFSMLTFTAISKVSNALPGLTVPTTIQNTGDFLIPSSIQDIGGTALANISASVNNDTSDVLRVAANRMFSFAIYRRIKSGSRSHSAVTSSINSGFNRIL